MISVKKTIDEKTGEVLFESKHHYVMFDEEKGYKVSGNKTPFYLFKNSFPDIVAPQDIGYLYMLSHTIKNGFLSYRSNKGFKATNFAKMAVICSCSPKTIKRSIGRLIKANVICKKKEEKEIRYYVNPLYLLANKWIEPKIYFMFEKDLKNVLPIWAKQEMEKVRKEING